MNFFMFSLAFLVTLNVIGIALGEYPPAVGQKAGEDPCKYHYKYCNGVDSGQYETYDAHVAVQCGANYQLEYCYYCPYGEQIKLISSTENPICLPGYTTYTAHIEEVHYKYCKNKYCEGKSKGRYTIDNSYLAPFIIECEGNCRAKHCYFCKGEDEISDPAVNPEKPPTCNAPQTFGDFI
eukprot:TCONS_00029355-protein